jgi:transcriptional regulator with XRE-family HTH domain
MSRMTDKLPAAVTEALEIAGNNIRVARMAKSFTMKTLAARMFVSTATVRRLERGDPSVSVGITAAALWALDLTATDVFPTGPGMIPPPVGGWPPYEPLPPHLANDDF